MKLVRGHLLDIQRFIHLSAIVSFVSTENCLEELFEASWKILRTMWRKHPFHRSFLSILTEQNVKRSESLSRNGTWMFSWKMKMKIKGCHGRVCSAREQNRPRSI